MKLGLFWFLSFLLFLIFNSFILLRKSASEMIKLGERGQVWKIVPDFWFCVMIGGGERRGVAMQMDKHRPTQDP